MPGVRFTTWLSEDERVELQARAKANQCSENVLVRYALRALLFNTAPPSWALKQEETPGVKK